ncbi:hypothetical protein ACUOFU_11475 [Microbacterium arabinogalactanolyticum]|uniref:hypothetical protein n=1 Tax=Microbacterium arabinogalactanolyticum TaxID=69365 RepID=UPI004043F2EF
MVENVMPELGITELAELGGRAFTVLESDGTMSVRDPFPTGQPTVLSFVSYSCPYCRSGATLLDELQSIETGRRLVASVYTEEAHPGENIPQTHSSDARIANARRYKDDFAVKRPIIVDSVTQPSISRTFQAGPNSVMLFDGDGVIQFYSKWLTLDVVRMIEHLLQSSARTDRSAGGTPRSFEFAGILKSNYDAEWYLAELMKNGPSSVIDVLDLSSPRDSKGLIK